MSIGDIPELPSGGPPSLYGCLYGKPPSVVLGLPPRLGDGPDAG
jgi:hypothetical protein